MWKPVSVFLLILVCGNAWSARSTSSADLNRWLNTTAPQLAEKLARHPKFKGSTIAFAPAHHNQLAAVKNRLYQNIEQVMSHNILSAGGNNIVSATSNGSCLRPEHSAQYIVGIAISAANNNAYTVQIKVLDHALGVWVSGISYRWQGQLSRSQKALLNRPAENVANGSVAAPFTQRQQQQTVSHLLQQIQCALPAGVDGLIYLRNSYRPEIEAAAANISRAVQQKLSARPQWIFTTQQSEAAWLMALRQEQASQQLPPQWTVVLTPVNTPKAPRVVASSYFQGAKDQVNPSDNPPSIPTEEKLAEYPGASELPATPAPRQLLGKLSWTPSRRCTNKQRDCVAVAFDLQADAYVMLFRTHNRRLKPASCDSATRIRKRGKLRYQISLPRHSPLPTGVYVVATQDENAFRRLRRTVHAAPGACYGANAQASSWLTAAERSITDQDSFDWQSLHLQNVHGTSREIREVR